MKISTKILFYLSIIALGSLLFVFYQNNEEEKKNNIFIKNFVAEKTKTFNTVLELKSLPLYKHVVDYSIWDEMVEFAQTGDTGWASVNIREISFPIFNANYSWSYDDSDSLTWVGSNIQDTFPKLLPLNQAIKKVFNEKEYTHFFIKTNDGIAEVFGANIRNTEDIDRNKKIHGRFFVGKLLDDVYIKEISALLDCKMILKTNKEIPDTSGYKIVTVNELKNTENIIVGYLYVLKDTSTLQELQNVSKKNYIVLIIFFTVLILSLFIILTQWIFVPLKRVTLALETENVTDIKSFFNKKHEFGSIANLLKRFIEQKEKISLQSEKLEKINIELETKSNHIKSSIEYALTIQNSILPREKQFNPFFQSFLIYRPKDIVSGDFYWFYKLPSISPSSMFAAVVDCTGHGVPGAFMTLITNRLLNNIVVEKNITEPAEILNLLDTGIVAALQQEDTKNNDGLDICLVKINQSLIDTNEYSIDFAGAKRPLMYYTQTEKNITYLRGSRRSIGGVYKVERSSFEQISISLKSGDILYLTTDGIFDQNNTQRKSFGLERVTNTLTSIVDLSFEEQKIKFCEIFDQFIGEEIQRDDVTLWGIKLL